MTKKINRKEFLRNLEIQYPDTFNLYKSQVDSLEDEVFDYTTTGIFGERLREERRDQNLTYAALARELNLDRSHIYYLEARNKIVDKKVDKLNLNKDKKYVRISAYRYYLLIISVVLDISPLYMIGLTDDRSYMGVM